MSNTAWEYAYLGTGADRQFTAFDNATAELHVCCTADCDPRLKQPVNVNLADSVRELAQQPKMQALADAIARYQPRHLRLDQLSVDISQFCQLVVPHMVGVRELVLRGCRDLSAADLIALANALTAADVRLSAFECALRDNIDGGDAVAALCRAQPSLERLCIAEFDDSHYHKTTQQRYALIAAIIGAAEPSALRHVSLTGTPAPMPFDVWWCDSSANMDAIRFSFWNSSRFATLSAHIESRSGKPQPASWYADELTV